MSPFFFPTKKSLIHYPVPFYDMISKHLPDLICHSACVTESCLTVIKDPKNKLAASMLVCDCLTVVGLRLTNAGVFSAP